MVQVSRCKVDDIRLTRTRDGRSPMGNSAMLALPTSPLLALPCQFIPIRRIKFSILHVYRGLLTPLQVGHGILRKSQLVLSTAKHYILNYLRTKLLVSLHTSTRVLIPRIS